ncbi:tubulin polyglutamylase, putative [Plasmopara halstedii]|uniref:Tubulin--tyrosine ligase-like protein 9 n=1 Tax=Plasmopara halstedii TaxID=4781 RepID=A0A0P1AV74_PLAHL|nr:tubulin polyglutamylase, putative [Plasmopara halstedii]CEG45296.1 tubulin polyglutamylase, putative [Plasmopara halstedii]|eukprot:XP_024581665.1 tubulin polyglutamylase, putative [Plasmopara halstedii]
MATKSQRRVFKHDDRVIYEWEQSMEEVNIYIKPPPSITAQQIQCDITTNHVMLGLRGVKDKFLNHDLTSSVVVAESYWMLESGELNINLQKMKKGFIWPSVFVGHGEMDAMQQEATKQQMMLERFQEENPGFDFSNAQFNGSAPDPRTFMGGVNNKPLLLLSMPGVEKTADRTPMMRVTRHNRRGDQSNSIQTRQGSNLGSRSANTSTVGLTGPTGGPSNTKGKTRVSVNNARGTNSSSNSVVRFKTTFRNTIYDTLLRRGWKETTENDWNFYWADRDYIYELLDTVHLDSSQRVNHYRNGRELCRKDLLIKNLKRAKRQAEKKAKSEDVTSSAFDSAFGSYDFFPATYILPGEYAIFVEEFKRNQGVWIMKPIGKAQGKGIFLFSKLNQVSEWRTDYRWRPENQQVETYVVQRYISDPYLVGGKKFDLRLYALVPSFSPLEIYLFRGGFARFTNSRYSNNHSDIANSFIHLTNVAVQKTSVNYNKQHGGKWNLRNLKLYMMSKHGTERIDKLFYEIQLVIIKSLLSVEKVIINDKHCFELYGYDVMIDENLKPWLLEVNASPSLSANTSSDYQLKCKMLNDMLDIIDLENRKPEGVVPEHVGGFDLVYRDGNITKANEGCMYTTFLGSELPASRASIARSTTS